MITLAKIKKFENTQHWGLKWETALLKLVVGDSVGADVQGKVIWKYILKVKKKIFFSLVNSLLGIYLID